MIARALIALTVVASLGRAQTPTSATNQARILWQGITRNLSAAAEEGSETLYSYTPTADVRTFGQLLAHVAGSERMFCAMALGERPGAEDQVEKTATSKAAIVAALKESNSYCNRAYAQSDAATSASIEVFGEIEITLELAGGALAQGMVGRQEGAELNSCHLRSLGILVFSRRSGADNLGAP